MKKLFTFAIMLMAVLTASATDYTDSLIVNFNGEAIKSDNTITLTQDKDGTYTFTLKNFMLGSGATQMPVGNVVVSGVQDVTDDFVNIPYAKMVDGLKVYSLMEGMATLTAGDQAGVIMWYGPIIGQVPVDVMAYVVDDKMTADIDVDLSAMSMNNVECIFGNQNIVHAEITYNDNLYINMAGQQLDPQESSMILTSYGDSETYDVSLPNLIVNVPNMGQMPLGTINMKGLKVVSDEDDIVTIAGEQDITIDNGDLEGVAMWFGPTLGPAPVKFNGVLGLSDDEMTKPTFTGTFEITISLGVVTCQFGGEAPSGINSIMADKNSSVEYNVAGQRVGKNYKGIVISSGKKYLK